ncbi:MAG: hypothetical protein ABWX67_02690, partial [Allosphingosinicella sp.]
MTAIARNDRAAAAREIEAFIIKFPHVLGGADIYNLDFGTPAVRIGMIAAALSGLVDEQRRPTVRRYVVIAPPQSDVGAWADSVWAQFVDAFQVLAGREMTPPEARVRRAMIEVIAAPDRRHKSLVDIVAAVDGQSAVIVADAASYRDDDVATYIAPGAAVPNQWQDVWVPQVHALASALTAVVRGRPLYAAIDTGELSPHRQALEELLLSIDGCGVMGSKSDESPETFLARSADQWIAWIGEGRLGRALQGVDALPTSLDRDKAFLRAQLLNRAGLANQALQIIRDELVEGSDPDAITLVKLARIAQDAGASALASQLLERAIGTLDSQEYLESALRTASEADLPELEDRIAHRLEALFPKSPGLGQRRLQAIVSVGDYAGAAEFARNDLDDVERAGFYAALARHFTSVDAPDYQALIDEADDDTALSEAYRMACVDDAIKRSLPVHALSLVLPLPSTDAQAERGERLLLRTLNDLLLVAGRNNVWPVDHDRFEAGVLALVERLADDPNKRSLRVQLVQLLEPAVAGTAGLAMLAMIVLHLASRPVALHKGRSLGTANMEWLLQHEEFIEAAFSWMKSEEPLVIGRSRLPAELLTESADEVLSGIADFLTVAPTGTQADEQAHLAWLALGSAIAPHASDPDYDLRLIRLAAGKLASTGAGQQARDLAELALMDGARSARRRRLGWFAMADVYARGGNMIEGLLALACTLAADDRADEEQAFQEITAVARLLRDCGLHRDARTAIERARKLLDRMGLSDAYGHQLDTLELQIRVAAFRMGDHDEAELEQLLADVVANGKDVLGHHAPTGPAGAMLGQLLRVARERKLDTAGAEAVFAELRSHAAGRLGDLLTTMSAGKPTAAELLTVIHGAGAARYSNDVGFDMRNIAIVASRALADDELLRDVEATSFVLDSLADRAVALPGWDEAAIPAAAPSMVGETAEIARDVSKAGISVVQAGFDEAGRLVRVSTVGGLIEEPVREAEDLILEKRMKQWAAEFPYAYGIDESTAN